MTKGFCTRGLFLLLICIDLFKSSTSYSMYSVSDAKKLHTKLFNESSYNKLFRPDNRVIVQAAYSLQYLNSVDIKSQIMSTTGWFSLYWNDSRLAWTTSFYGDIEYIYVPIDLVWHPDLIVLNSVLELEKKFGAERTIRISNNGELRWEPIAVLSTSCAMVVAFFPFDTQYCSIDLASFDYPEDAVELIPEYWWPVNLGLHDTHGDWKLEDTFCSFSPIYDEEDVTYSRLQFGLVIKRLPDHYLLIVILPTILTAVLTFVSFCLPLKSGVRIGYILTVVLALVVLLTLFADTIPSAAEYPSILVALLTVTLGMAFLLIIITIFVMRLYKKPKQYTAPNCMHSFVRKFRKLKLKLQCRKRARRINHIEQNQAIEDGQPKEETDSVENSTPLKPYSNKELAEFFDNFLFVAFTVLYILILLSAPIVAVVWVNNSKSN